MTMIKSDLTATWLGVAKSVAYLVAKLFAIRPFSESPVIVRVKGELYQVNHISTVNVTTEHDGGIVSREVVVIEAGE